MSLYTKALPRHYSGDLSRGFWRRIKRLERRDDRSAWGAAYALGCLLQTVEEQALRALEHAQRTR